MDTLNGFCAGAIMWQIDRPAHWREWGKSAAWIAGYRCGAMTTAMAAVILSATALLTLLN